MSGHKGINAKFSIGLPDFVTSVEAIKNKKSTEVEQVVTDSNGNTYKVKTKIDELDSKVLEASKNSGGSPDFKWGNPKSGPTYGHTFIDHTSKLKDSQLIDRARSLKHQVGKWVNDQEAAAFLSNVAKNGPGVYDVPLPDNLKGKVFLPDGTEISPNMVRVVVKPTGGVKTGFPFNDKYPTSKPKDF